MKFTEFIPSAYAKAQDVGLSTTEQPGGVKVVANADPGELLGKVIENSITILFTIGAIGFTIMIVWGGVSWILSGGDKEKVAGARKKVTTALIGLVLLSLSYVIMAVAGQILDLKDLETGSFTLPSLNRK